MVPHKSRLGRSVAPATMVSQLTGQRQRQVKLTRDGLTRRLLDIRERVGECIVKRVVPIEKRLRFSACRWVRIKALK